MPIRKILAPLSGTKDDEPLISGGLMLAKMFDAHMRALVVPPEPNQMMPFMGEGFAPAALKDVIEATRKAGESMVKDTEARLTQAAEGAGVPLVEKGPLPRPSAQFWSETGIFQETVTEHAKLSDLVMFPHASVDAPADYPDAFENCLLAADRPALLLPRDGTIFETLSTVCIGWDGSAEASQAVLHALPFMKRAQNVVAIRIARAEQADKHKGALAEYLSLHDIAVREELVEPGGRGLGKILLESAAGVGADLLVLGGYGQNRLRSMVFGSVTRHVVANAPLPVLMSH